MTGTKKIKEEGEEEEKEVDCLHEATLFLPLPNGQAKLYKLFGKSVPPEPEDEINEEVEAKKGKYINIPVKNWLKTAQRFKVEWQMESEEDQTTFIRAANTFDVPASSTKNYKLNFLTYKAGDTNFSVTFKNTQTNEYLFYKIHVNAQESGVLRTIELQSPVREVVTETINIENPTKQEVTIDSAEFTLDNDNILIEPDKIVLQPNQEKGFKISYRPL